jgi:hypothetical protein
MLVTMYNSELIDKLVTIACGDIELVQNAIRSVANQHGEADLKGIVEYIVSQRREQGLIS